MIDPHAELIHLAWVYLSRARLARAQGHIRLGRKCLDLAHATRV